MGHPQKWYSVRNRKRIHLHFCSMMLSVHICPLIPLWNCVPTSLDPQLLCQRKLILLKTKAGLVPSLRKLLKLKYRAAMITARAVRNKESLKRQTRKYSSGTIFLSMKKCQEKYLRLIYWCVFLFICTLKKL